MRRRAKCVSGAAATALRRTRVLASHFGFPFLTQMRELRSRRRETLVRLEAVPRTKSFLAVLTLGACASPAAATVVEVQSTPQVAEPVEEVEEVVPTPAEPVGVREVELQLLESLGPFEKIADYCGEYWPTSLVYSYRSTYSCFLDDGKPSHILVGEGEASGDIVAGVQETDEEKGQPQRKFCQLLLRDEAGWWVYPVEEACGLDNARERTGVRSSVKLDRLKNETTELMVVRISSTSHEWRVGMFETRDPDWDPVTHVNVDSEGKIRPERILRADGQGYTETLAAIEARVLGQWEELHLCSLDSSKGFWCSERILIGCGKSKASLSLEEGAVVVSGDTQLEECPAGREPFRGRLLLPG